MKRLNPIVLLLAVYILAMMIVSAGTGHLAHLGDDQLLFGTNDSKGYRTLANYYSFGDETPPQDMLIRLRPFVYPFFLSLQRLVGTTAFQVIQIILNLLTIYVLYRTALLVSNRRWLSTVCATLLAVTPTFSFIAYHALTETLGLLLCTLFLYTAFQAYMKKKVNYLVISGLILSLLVCAKPVVFPIFLVYGIISSIRLLRARATKNVKYLVTLLALPMVVQLALTGVLTGGPVLSTAGSVNFGDRFFPVVYGFVEYDRFLNYKSPEAATAKSIYPTVESKLWYSIRHPSTILRATSYLLVNEHILAGSNYVSLPRNLQQPPSPTSSLLGRFSKYLNMLFLAFHILFVVSLAYFTLFRWKRLAHASSIVWLYLLALSILLPSVLVYWQGDRLVLLAQPVWLLVYGWLLATLLNNRTTVSNPEDNPR